MRSSAALDFLDSAAADDCVCRSRRARADSHCVCIQLQRALSVYIHEISATEASINPRARGSVLEMHAVIDIVISWLYPRRQSNSVRPVAGSPPSVYLSFTSAPDSIPENASLIIKAQRATRLCNIHPPRAPSGSALCNGIKGC